MLGGETSSMVSAKEWTSIKDVEAGLDEQKIQSHTSNGDGRRGVQEGRAEIGYGDIARIGWERVARRVKGEVEP